MTKRAQLIALADRLDQVGQYDLADAIDKDFEEFLKLLEEGKLTFEDLVSGGSRDPRLPYSNRGRELPLCGIPGLQ